MKFLILFPDHWASFSPTLINYVNELCDRGCDVTVLTTKLIGAEGPCESNSLMCQKITINNTILKNWGLALKLFNFAEYHVCRLFKLRTRINLYKLWQFIILYKPLVLLCGRKKFDHFVAFDSVAFALLSVTGVINDIDFVSLEISRDTIFDKLLVKSKKIKSCVSQSPVRFNLQFNKATMSGLFFIPNAPNFSNLLPKKMVNGTGLLYLGSFCKEFGADFIIDIARNFPELHITLHGLVPENFLKSIPNNIQLDKTYFDQDMLASAICNYDIGLVFYDFSCISESVKEQFETVPSGKLYNYFNAGIPVIGINIEGLRPVLDFNAGVLIERLDLNLFDVALRDIKHNYSYYSENAIRAAKFFSFRESSSHYFNNLLRNH